MGSLVMMMIDDRVGMIEIGSRIDFVENMIGRIILQLAVMMW